MRMNHVDGHEDFPSHCFNIFLPVSRCFLGIRPFKPATCAEFDDSNVCEGTGGASQIGVLNSGALIPAGKHLVERLSLSSDSVCGLKPDLASLLTFPERLRLLLQKGAPNVIWWLPDGDCFCLVPDAFDQVLNEQFHGTKFESFTRKLNRW